MKYPEGLAAPPIPGTGLITPAQVWEITKAHPWRAVLFLAIGGAIGWVLAVITGAS
jgi:hypothetical protein